MRPAITFASVSVGSVPPQPYDAGPRSDGDELEQVDHVRVRDADDAERRLLDGDVELLGEGPQSLAGAIDVELDLAAEEVARVDAACDHVRVGERGVGPAPAVRRRSEIGRRRA